VIETPTANYRHPGAGISRATLRAPLLARFHLRLSQPKAAIARPETVLNGFRGSGVEAEALWLMGKTYKESLGKPDLACGCRSASDTGQVPGLGYAVMIT
jgi:hypothetical protein